MAKPDCCERAEAVGGDCPHDADPEFFGPGGHVPRGEQCREVVQAFCSGSEYCELRKGHAGPHGGW